jgi:hypothetical protein
MDVWIKLLIWLAPAIAAGLLWKFWEWLVRRICGKPRPEIVAILMFLSVAIPAMVFVVIFNYERIPAAETN